MNKQPSKKLKSKQKTIAVLALIVTVFLAICITFAWYTNRINIMNGKFTLGSFDYNVTLFDVSGTTATQVGTQHYDVEDTDAWSYSAEEINMGSNSVKYQVLKVENNSGFDIKAYEYLTYNTMDEQQTALANYFYFKPYLINVPHIGGNTDEQDVSAFLASYSFPAASDISSPVGEVTFGTIKNNAVALEKGTVSDAQSTYYLLAYCVTGLPNEMLGGSYAGKTVDVNPVITIGQANGPIPQTTSSSRVIYADSWQSLRTAINAANSGDTIYLTRDVESPVGTNLSLTNGVNLNLNGYKLKIHGDLVFNYKTTDMRKMTVPRSSELVVDGDLYITSLGGFTINSTNTARNIFLGKYNSSTGTASGGHIYANCALSVTDNTSGYSGSDDQEYLNCIIPNEDSGLVISNVRICKMGSDGNYTAADLTVAGGDTMVKIGTGAELNAINVPSGKHFADIYIVNYGSIDTIDLSNVEYNWKTRTVGAYVKNYNEVTTLNLRTGSSGAKGIGPAGRDYFNTRVINGDGAVTAFSGDYNAPYFVSTDIEPLEQSGDDSLVVQNDAATGVYTVYLKDVAANTGTAESITGLFTAYGYDCTQCTSLKIVTNNGITLKPSQFENIRDNFTNITKIDLSSAAIDSRTIPANAMDATVSGSKTANLSEVVLPITSVNIGNSAFKGTKIEQITIGSNVESIGTNAFNVADGTKLEVLWDGAVSIPSAFLAGFDVDKTTIFMDASLAQVAMTSAYTDAWKLNMYENYEFKAENGAYYCKYARDGSTATGCEIIYYAGTIASKEGDDLVPDMLNDGSSNYTVVGVERQAFKKAVIADGGATVGGVDIDLSSCTKVGDSAFEGTSTAPLTVNDLTLGNVNSIGSYAFKNHEITYCEPRPNGFEGTNYLGSYAFQGSHIYGGILDLHGIAEKYTPEESALAGLIIQGSYAGNSDTGNAILDLSNTATIRSSIATGSHFYCDIDVTNVDSIGSNAFKNTISANGNNTHVIDARDVKAIGESAFFGIECDKLYLGTSDADILAESTGYTSIIGTTSGNNIQTLVLDGTFTTNAAPALASTSSGESVTIQNLKIAIVRDGNDDIQTTTIPAYAFATPRTVSGTSFTQSPNLTINNVITSETTGEPGSEVTTYASFNIGEYAFAGTGFTAAEKDFEGVIEIGAHAFEASTIVAFNLGESINKIYSESFIRYCDSLRSMVIQTVVPEPVEPEEGEPEPEPIDYTQYLVELVGTAAADEKISSTGTKIGTTANPFRITVPTALLQTYIADTVWKGWSNYFAGEAYEYTDGNHVWKYYIINPDTSDPDAIAMGVHIVGYEYKGTRTDLTGRTSAEYIKVPGTITAPNGQLYWVTEFGEDKDLFADIDKNYPNPSTKMQCFIVDFKSAAPYLKYINGLSLQSDRLWGIDYTTSATNAYRKSGNQLLKITKDERSIVRVFDYSLTWNSRTSRFTCARQSATTFNIGATVTNIQKGAFSGNQTINTVKVVMPGSGEYDSYHDRPLLNYIEAGAFANSKVTTFDFRNCYDRVPDNNGFYSNSFFIHIGESALGLAREKVLNSSGYYEYVGNSSISIIVPKDITISTDNNNNPYKLEDKYKDSSEYFLYAKYGCITAENPDSRGSSVEDDAKKAKTQAEAGNQMDVSINGFGYHVMDSGASYKETVYSSKTSAHIAILTSVSKENGTESKLVIPSTISVKGVNYELVAITDSAFGANDSLQTLVLPNKDVAFSSAAFAGCIHLENIQYNDILAITESARETIAAVPAESAQSFVEDRSEDTEGE
ncbi:MAG: leucine-rich repeat protein [Clostridia bacterium]|nr:leucine-rich repeat protein [Clostridia bacterium]